MSQSPSADSPSPDPLASYDWEFHSRCRELLARPCEPEEMQRLVDSMQKLRERYALAAIGTLLAEALNQLGDGSAAEQVLQEDVRAGIADQWTHYWLAHQLGLRGEFDQAALHIRRSHAMRGWHQSEDHSYWFSHDYFSGSIGEWQQWFQIWIREGPLEAIKVGVGQGGTTLWLLDHVIGPRGGTICCVDSWLGSSGYQRLDEQLTADQITLEQLFDANLIGSGHNQHAGKVRKLVGEVVEQLAAMEPACADLIWIDGSPGAEGVIQHALLAHRLLRRGGFLVFDDYPAQLLDYRQNPGRAVDFFLSCFREHYRMLARGQQVLLQRRHQGAQPLPQRLLLLLGMHRSGTSALAGLLQSQGFLAPRDVPPADANNPSGYWEPQRIVACHTALMEQLHTSWDDPLLVEEGLMGERLPANIELLEQALGQAFPHDAGQVPGVALIKDPRQCRLQLLWNALIAAHQIDAAAVLILRDPMAVVQSLRRRDQLPINRSLLLWLQHTLEAERHTRHLPRFVVTYEQLLDNPEAVLQRCQQFWPDQAWMVTGGFQIDRNLNHGALDQAGPQPGQNAEPALLELALKVYGLLAQKEPDLGQLDHAHGLVRERLQLVEEQLGRNVTLQLFWQMEGQAEFCEHQSERLSLAIGRGHTRAQLTLPPMELALVALRLDPAEQPGIMNLQRLALLDHQGRKLWQWQQGDGACLPLHPATASTRLMEKSIVCLDHDPGVILQIPLPCLEPMKAGGTLQVDGHWEPLSAELGGMLKAMT